MSQTRNKVTPNTKSQKDRREKFSNAGLKRLDIYINEETEKQLFEILTKAGYDDYSTEKTKGKTFDISSFLNYVVREIYVDKLHVLPKDAQFLIIANDILVDLHKKQHTLKQVDDALTKLDINLSKILEITSLSEEGITKKKQLHERIKSKLEESGTQFSNLLTTHKLEKK